MGRVVTDKKAVDELLTRGVEEVIVKEDLKKALLSGRKLRVKLGIDPTSTDIHIGRAVQLRKLKAFQDIGHSVVFIVGDFTGVIGDTSDKDAERPMMSATEVKKNIKTYFSQALKILDRKNIETQYNSKWLRKLGFHEIGKLADAFGLHEISARENVKKRLDSGKRVSLREVLYPLMQGYDSVAVKADIEIGGTDQKFNLLAGRTIQGLYNQKPQNILTTTLLEGLDGRKMSSSWGNTINITDSPKEMFGKVMSLDDNLIEKYFLLCTDTREEDIATIMKRNPRDAKLELAKTIVALYHKKGAGEKEKNDFIKLYSKKDFNVSDLLVYTSKKGKQSILNLLLARQGVKLSNLKSKANARYLLEQGAIEINGKEKKDPHEIIDVQGGETLRIGKKFFRIKV